jgi:hypothetical protein
MYGSVGNTAISDRRDVDTEVRIMHVETHNSAGTASEGSTVTTLHEQLNASREAAPPTLAPRQRSYAPTAQRASISQAAAHNACKRKNQRTRTHYHALPLAAVHTPGAAASRTVNIFTMHGSKYNAISSSSRCGIHGTHQRSQAHKTAGRRRACTVHHSEPNVQYAAQTKVIDAREKKT